MTIRARNDTKEIEKERKKSGISFLRAVNVPKEIHKWIHKRAKEKSARKSSRGSRVKPGIFFLISEDLPRGLEVGDRVGFLVVVLVIASEGASGRR